MGRHEEKWQPFRQTLNKTFGSFLLPKNDINAYIGVEKQNDWYYNTQNTYWLITMTTVDNELPNGFAITKETDGYAVKFPKALLDQFKPHFKGAKWRSASLTWLIGSRSKTKFLLWAKEMADEAIKLEALDALETQESIEQFIASLQKDKIEVLKDRVQELSRHEALQDEYNDAQYALKELEKTMKSLMDSLEKRRSTKSLLQSSLEKIEALQSQRNELQTEAAKELSEIKVMVHKAIDVQAVRDAYNEIAKRFGKVGSRIRHEFEEAQDKIREQQQVLHSIGLHSEGMQQMYTMNMNRPDRDKLPPFDSIYEIVEYETDDD